MHFYSQSQCGLWRGLFTRAGKFLGFRSRSLFVNSHQNCPVNLKTRNRDKWMRIMCTKVSFFSFPNSFTDLEGSGKATAGVFQYFSWGLLQPFRGNPEYSDVADLPYDTTCLTKIQNEHTDMKSLSKFPFHFLCTTLVE